MIRPLVVLCAFVALGGCENTRFAGLTSAEISGQLCGQPFAMRVTDGKERSNFKLECKTADGGSATIETTDIRAFEGQQITGRLLDTVVGLTSTAVRAAAGLPPAPLERLATPETARGDRP